MRPRTSRIRLACFDWNNTLLDDLAQAHQAMCAIFEHCNKPSPSIEEYVRAASSTGNWNAIFDLHGITMPIEEIRPMYIARYLEFAHETRLTTHARETLEQLRYAGIEVHIITAARQELAEPLMHSHNIVGLCNEIHFFANDKKACIREILKRRRVEPHEVALIGDMRSDVEHALLAGVHAIAIHSPHVPQELFANMADRHVYAHSLLEVADYLLST